MQQPTDPATRGGVDWPSLIAIGGVCLGWFVLDAVALRAGHFITGFRFYELAALIDRPTRLLTGGSAADSPLTIPFVALCAVAILAATAPLLTPRPLARLGSLAPLALMLACSAILYYKASQDTFVAPADPDPVAQALADFGNAIVRRTGAVLSRHLSPASGAWIAGIAAVYLAYRGIRGRRPPVAAPRPRV